MQRVSGSQVVTAAEAAEMPLPPQIQEALGELVGVAREGLLALSVGVGLSVVESGRVSRRLRIEDDLSSGQETLRGCHDPGSTQMS